MTAFESMTMRHCTSPLILALALSACTGSDAESTPPGATSSSAPATAAVDTSRGDSLVMLADRSRILGEPDAPVWVVIVSDFQCPFCKVWHDRTFPALMTEFVETGRIRLAYLNLPLQQHQHAQVTAEMALCAGAQGRFWEFHDAVFDTQDEWSALPTGTSFFDTVAATAGVDQKRLQACMDARAMRALVRADYQRAIDARTTSTPTFFIGNDIRIQGAHPIEVFRDSIAKALRGSRAGAG
jgi:protein-disulfide isomerase